MDQHRRGCTCQGGGHVKLTLFEDDGDIAHYDITHQAAHAAGDDHPAIFGNGFTDGFKALFLGAVEKPAGVHENDVRALIIG